MSKSVSEKDLIQLITGECSPPKRKQIENWLKEKPENREQLKKLRRTWEISANLELQENEDEVWHELSQRIANPSHLTIHRLGPEGRNGEEKDSGEDTKSKSLSPRHRQSEYSKNWLSRIAAVCLLIIGALYLLYDYGGTGEGKQNDASGLQEVVANRGERMNLTLSDGTSVVLNSSSAIRYPSHFNGENRVIELEGEAFFSVARDVNKPFLVHTNGAVIRVSGTKFNVSAYAYLDGVEVVVEDGEVAVKSDSLSAQQNRASSEVTLGEGEYTVVKEGAVPTSPVTVALDHYLGWINGDLVFKATPLDVVIKKLELYYNRDFEVSDPRLYNRKLTVTFKKESLSKVLDVLSVAMDIAYEQSDSLIYLEPSE